ncbi:MAG TPA: ribonuclease HI [Sediminispirochaeta sp.]|nr:ribonuclease HI [Sediminispirochaeta sp.]
MATKTIEIYTDGGCSGNPGPGGWAFVLRDGEEHIERSGGDDYTTNNKMELTAVIQALAYVGQEKRGIEVYTDSRYVKNGISSWIHKWERNGWMTSAKKPVKNRELWQKLKSLSDDLQVHWHWVKGHAGDRWNERCDQLVQEEMAKRKK